MRRDHHILVQVAVGRRGVHVVDDEEDDDLEEVDTLRRGNGRDAEDAVFGHLIEQLFVFVVEVVHEEGARLIHVHRDMQQLHREEEDQPESDQKVDCKEDRGDCNLWSPAKS